MGELAFVAKDTSPEGVFPAYVGWWFGIDRGYGWAGAGGSSLPGAAA